jgi:hypothetical protein
VVDPEVADSDPEHAVAAKHTMRAVPTKSALGTRLPAQLSLPSINSLSLYAIKFFGHSPGSRIAGVPGSRYLGRLDFQEKVIYNLYSRIAQKRFSRKLVRQEDRRRAGV